MKIIKSLFKNNLVKIIALLAIALLYVVSRQPAISQAERSTLSGRFSFQQVALPDESGMPHRNVREVAPSMKNISGWVSTVGAGVALNDIDGDGLSNDLCKVDPRSDNVSVAPAPLTGERFAPFTLDPGTLINRRIMAPMGCIPNDYNEDGITDILVYYWGRTPIIFLGKSQAKLPFVPIPELYVAQELHPGGERWFTGAATVADLDGDGHLDIVIGNYYQDGAEVLDTESTIRQNMQHSMSRAANGGRSRILRFEKATAGEAPTVSYTAVEDYIEADTPAEKDELTHGWTLAIGAFDIDGDLLPELYFANDFGIDRFLHNFSEPGQIRFKPLVGRKGFTTPNSKIAGHDSFKGMGVDAADVNQDGLFDFFVSNIAAEFALEESHLLFLSNGKTSEIKSGRAPYIDQSEELGVSRSGWGWDAKFGDFDNNGELELLQATGFLKGEIDRWAELHEIAMGNDQLLSNPYNWHKFQPGDDLGGNEHNPFYVRAADGRFYDLAREIGLDQPYVTRGIATADVNDDGKLDFAIANQWETSFFYLNQSPQNASFIGLRLRLPVGNENDPSGASGNLTRPAIGAWVSVEMPDGRKKVGFVDGGNGHSGKRSSEVHFGLGDLPDNQELNVEIRWRDSQGQVNQRRYALKPSWHNILLEKHEGVEKNG